MDLSKLAEPFPASDVEWRVGRAGEKNGKVWAMCLAYITNRAIMERLDEAVGPENWCNEFREAPHGGVLCGISIRVDDGWVTKWDGAENTDIEGVKGGLSGSMKRAGVQWGIGRYLYNLEEGWANVHPNGAHSGKADGKWFKWDPPELPTWALPKGAKPAPSVAVDGRTGEIIDVPDEPPPPPPAHVPVIPSNGNHDPIDDLVGFGKHKDLTWRQVLVEYSGYVDWALESLDSRKMPDDLRRSIEAQRTENTVVAGMAADDTLGALAPANGPPSYEGEPEIEELPF